MNKLLLFLALLLAVTSQHLHAGYVHLLATSGYNADIIANGTGAANTKTNNDVDGGGYALLSIDWKLTATSTPLTMGLPANGLISSATTSGLSFQMRNFDSNNVARINTLNTSSTFNLQTPTGYINKLYVLAMSGSGTSTMKVKVNFSDNTFQEATGIVVADWYNGANTAISIGNRITISTNTVDASQTYSGPRIYQYEVNIDVNNINKTITSIEVSKTAGTGYLNVFAFTGQQSGIMNPIELGGYNADVIANGVGTGMSKTTNDVDGVNYIFKAIGWQASSTVTAQTTGLPTNGILTSAFNSAVQFKFAPWSNPYEGNNSLRLTTNGSNGILQFAFPQAASTLHILATSGSGVSNMNVQVNFQDLTNEIISNITVGDWYNGTNYAVTGIGRSIRSTDVVENNTTNPRIYHYQIPISAANQSKTISSVQFTKNTSSATGAVLNIFAITTENPIPQCANVTNIQINNITNNSAAVTWTYTGSASQFQIKYSPAGFSPATGGTAIITNTNPTVISGLTLATSYDVYVRTICGVGDTSSYSLVTNFTTTCNPPPILTRTDSSRCGNGIVTLLATTSTSNEIRWYAAPTGGTALNIGNTYTPNVTNTTTFYVAAANGNCESMRQTVVATVHPLPVVNLGNDTTICPNATITLGANNSAANTYLWNNNATTSSINITTAGTYFVHATSANNCTNTDTIVVAQGQNPTHSLPATDYLCDQQTLLLNPNAPTNTTTVWNNSATTPQLAVSTPGTYSVTIKNANNCQVIATCNVIAKPNPNVDLGPDFGKCQYDTIDLSANYPNANYLWNTNDTTEIINIINDGTYYVMVTDQFGCIGYDTVEISYMNQPTVGGFNFIPMLNSDPMTIKFYPENPQDVTGYLWDFGDGTTSTQMEAIHTYTSSGDYTVQLTLINNCGTSTYSLPIHADMNTGIRFVDPKNMVNVYPNPATHVLNINAQEQEILTLTISDISGKIIKTIPNVKERTTQINIDELNTGIYLLGIETNNGIQYKKIQKLQ